MPPVTSLLTDPEEFMRERGDDPSLKGPLVVVTLVAFLSALALVVQYQTLVTLVESIATNASDGANGNASAEFDTDLFIQVFLVSSFLVALVGPFIIWLIYAGVFHGISVVFDGEGAFSDTLALVGWGFVPNIVGSAVSLVINFYRFEIQDPDVPTDVTYENVQEFLAEFQGSALAQLDTGLGILFTLWSAYIWLYAMQYARDLSRRDALLTIAIPVLVGLLWTIQNLLSAMSA